MSAAQVIDFEAFRQKRLAQHPASPQALTASGYPASWVWVWVWPVVG